MTTETPETEKAGITPEPLVDLDAKKKRREEGEALLRLDGKLYRIRSLDEFGIRERKRLDRDGREFYKLYESDEESETDEQRLEMLVDRMFDAALDAPAAIRKKIHAADKVDVVLGFTQSPLLKVLAAARVIQQAQEEALETATPITGS